MRVILSDNGIEEAIKKGDINVLDKDKVLSRDSALLQPASLDLTLDENQKDLTVQPLPGLEQLGERFGRSPLKPHPKVGKDFVTFWPGYATTCALNTILGYNSALNPFIEIRSTMRRNGLDKIIGEAKDSDPSRVEIYNGVGFPVSVEIGSKLCQAIWEKRNSQTGSVTRDSLLSGEGYVVTEEDEIHALVQKGEIYIDGETARVQDNMLCFYACRKETRNESTHVIITRDNKKHGLKIVQDEREVHRFSQGEFVDIQTNNRLELSPRVAIHVQSLPRKAGVFGIGWVDPGFRGPFSVQPKTDEPEDEIREGELVALGQIMYFPHGVRMAYGDANIGSQYQNRTIGRSRQLMLFESLWDSSNKSG